MQLAKIFGNLPYKGYYLEYNNWYSEQIVGLSLNSQNQADIISGLSLILFNGSPSVDLFSESLYPSKISVENKFLDLEEKEIIINKFEIKDYISYINNNFSNLQEDGSVILNNSSLLGFTFDGLLIFSTENKVINSVKKFLTNYFVETYYSSYGNIFFAGIYDSNNLSEFTKSPLSYNYPSEETDVLLKELAIFEEYNFNLTNNYIHYFPNSLRFDLVKLDKIIFFLSSLQDIKSVYHGVTAQRLGSNALLIETSAYDNISFLTLQSFIRKIFNLKNEIQNNLEEIILDRSIFFNELFILGIYDSGIDIIFLDKNTEISFMDYMRMQEV